MDLLRCGAQVAVRRSRVPTPRRVIMRHDGDDANGRLRSEDGQGSLPGMYSMTWPMFGLLEEGAIGLVTLCFL